MHSTAERKIIEATKAQIRGYVTYQEIADALNISLSYVGLVFSFRRPYNQSIIDMAIQLHEKELKNKNIALQSTAKRLRIKI